MISRQVGDISYKLLPGSDRTTTDIVIERSGEIVVRPPKDMPPELVDNVVNSKRIWIYRNLAEWRDLNASAVAREWVNGETFLYLGRSYRLSIVANESGVPLSLKDGRFLLSRSIIERDGIAGARKAFETYYQKKGEERLGARVKYFAPKVGVEIPSVKVTDVGFKWARCGRSGDLAFHWKCMMAPARILDYLAVHELCHLLHKNHSATYWNEVDKVMPDYRERKEWLRKHGAGLDI